MKQNLNLWELLKASRGLPVSDPMARLWGYQYQQKHGVSEISGVPPLRFMSRGGYLQDYRIYGNTVQNGTPTPENPVEVQGCGERTENLFDVKSSINPNNVTENSPYFVNSSGRYAFSFPVDIGETYILSFYTKNIDVVANQLDFCVCSVI